MRVTITAPTLTAGVPPQGRRIVLSCTELAVAVVAGQPAAPGHQVNLRATTASVTGALPPAQWLVWLRQGMATLHRELATVVQQVVSAVTSLRFNDQRNSQYLPLF